MQQLFYIVVFLGNPKSIVEIIYKFINYNSCFCTKLPYKKDIFEAIKFLLIISCIMRNARKWEITLHGNYIKEETKFFT